MIEKVNILLANLLKHCEHPKDLHNSSQVLHKLWQYLASNMNVTFVVYYKQLKDYVNLNEFSQNSVPNVNYFNKWDNGQFYQLTKFWMLFFNSFKISNDRFDLKRILINTNNNCYVSSFLDDSFDLYKLLIDISKYSSNDFLTDMALLSITFAVKHFEPNFMIGKYLKADDLEVYNNKYLSRTDHKKVWISVGFYALNLTYSLNLETSDFKIECNPIIRQSLNKFAVSIIEKNHFPDILKIIALRILSICNRKLIDESSMNVSSRIGKF